MSRVEPFVLAVLAFGIAILLLMRTASNRVAHSHAVSLHRDEDEQVAVESLSLQELTGDLVDLQRGAKSPSVKYGIFSLDPAKFNFEPSESKRQSSSVFPAIYNHTGEFTGELVVNRDLFRATDGSMQDPSKGDKTPSTFWSVLQLKDPRLLYVHNILSPQRCMELMAVAQTSMERSLVIDKQVGKKSNVDPVRTSYGTFLVGEQNGEFSEANRILRVHGASLLGLKNVNHCEATQVLRYDAGQYYKSHVDYFDPWDHYNMDRGGQRIATVLVWLNDVAEGGETSFPKVGVALAPRQGDAVLFYSMDEDGAMNPYSEHGAIPPKPGSQKWVAVLWCHPRTFL